MLLVPLMRLVLHALSSNLLILNHLECDWLAKNPNVHPAANDLLILMSGYLYGRPTSAQRVDPLTQFKWVPGSTGNIRIIVSSDGYTC